MMEQRQMATVQEIDDLADYVGSFEAHFSNGRLIAGNGGEPEVES